MTKYDFIVINKTYGPTGDAVKYRLIVEKVAVLDDDRTLDIVLQEAGVSSYDVGLVIEQLEALPYGAKHVYAYGDTGRILIEQV